MGHPARIYLASISSKLKAVCRKLIPPGQSNLLGSCICLLHFRKRGKTSAASQPSRYVNVVSLASDAQSLMVPSCSCRLCHMSSHRSGKAEEHLAKYASEIFGAVTSGEFDGKMDA